MSRTRGRNSMIAAIAAGAMLFACAAEDGDGNNDNGSVNDDPVDEGQVGDVPVDDGQVDNGDVNGAPGTDPDEDLPGDDFDQDEAEQRAEELIGTPEDEVPEDDETRIVARGDESFPSTDDHVPGRANVTLDEVDGEWIVTHVMIETDGDAPEIEAALNDDNGGQDALGCDDLDPDEQQRADDLIGTPEDEVPEDDTRIVARGDESFDTTDDLVPGRADVTLDEVDGEWIVTSVRIPTDAEEEVRADLDDE